MMNPCIRSDIARVTWRARITLIFLAALILSSAAVSPAAAQGSISFSVDRTSITRGQCVTFRWSIPAGWSQYGFNPSISMEWKAEGFRGGAAITDSVQYCPDATRTYQMSVSFVSGAPQSRSLTVNVAVPVAPTITSRPPTLTLQPPTRTEPQQPSIQPPIIVLPPPPSPSISFTASPSSITQGQCSDLTWDVENVVAVYQDGYGVGGHSTRRVCPTTTTQYDLRVQTSSGEQTRSVTVFVSSPGAPPSSGRNSITVDKSQVLVGEQVNICYTVIAPSHIDILVLLDNGTSRTFASADDDGRGGCFQGVGGEPLGKRRLVLNVNSSSAGAASVETSYAVVSSKTSEQPPVQPQPVPAQKPVLQLNDFTVLQEHTALTSFSSMDSPQVLKPSMLWFSLSNKDQPVNNGAYKLTITTRDSSGKQIENYRFWAGEYDSPEYASLGPNSTQNLRTTLYFKHPVKDGKIEVALEPDSSLGAPSALRKAITIQKHEDSWCVCGAEIAHALAILRPELRAIADPADKIRKVCELDGSLVPLEISKWMYSQQSLDAKLQMTMLSDLLFIIHMVKKDYPACSIISDWTNAYLNELIRRGVRGRGLITGSPVYPLVMNQQGQRAGFLPDGTIVNEIPGSYAFAQDDLRMIFYPSDMVGDIAVTGYAGGTMDVYDIGARDANVSTNVYEHVPVKRGTRAVLSTAAQPSLSVDLGGDGTTKFTLEPSYVRSRPLDADENPIARVLPYLIGGALILGVIAIVVVRRK